MENTAATRKGALGLRSPMKPPMAGPTTKPTPKAAPSNPKALARFSMGVVSAM